MLKLDGKRQNMHQLFFIYISYLKYFTNIISYNKTYLKK